MLDYKEIGEILSLINSSSCDELVLETESVKLVVRRNGAGSATSAVPLAASAMKEAPAATSKSVSTPANAAGKEPSPKSPLSQTGLVGAPMVGTFYRAPSPEEPAFVEIGAKVKVGDPLCVIEVMKLFTTIHAEIAGTVREIGAEDAQLVEFGQMIFVIEPE